MTTIIVIIGIMLKHQNSRLVSKAPQHYRTLPESLNFRELLRPVGDVDHLHPESTAVGDGPSRSHRLCGLPVVFGGVSGSGV